MKIRIIVKPSAREEKIEKISDSEYKVSVKEPAKEGRANWAIERAMGKYFKIPPSQVKIILGFTSRRKILEINL